MNLKSDLAAKLRDVLDNMSQEEFDKEWSEITALNLQSPSFSEAIEYFALMQDQLGHLVEGGFKKNPPQKQRHYKTHEKKACHYEEFAVKSFMITNELMKHIKN